MSQLKKKFIGNNQVDETKIRLNNDAYLRARNAADSADVNIVKVDANDRILLASLPQASGSPTVANDLVNKGYVDSVLEGLKPKEAVRAASTIDLTLSGEQTVDGIALVSGDRILVKNQTAAEENGIYVVDSGAWSRSLDFDSLTPIDEINGAYVAVQEGTVNQGKLFVQTGLVATLDTDPINFVFYNSIALLVGGDGITISSNTISVDHDGEGLTFVANQLALELDGATLSKSSAGLKVADLGIDTAQLADNAVTKVKIADDAVGEAELDLAEVDADTFVLSAAYAPQTGTVTIGDSIEVAIEKIVFNQNNALNSVAAKETFTLNGTDITNQYVDLDEVADASSIIFNVQGAPLQLEDTDYSVDLTGGAGGNTRITFVGDLATAGLAALEAGDIIQVQYTFQA
jgi:hypothetical protein